MENMLKVTKYEVLGQLPDLFTAEDGSRVKTLADWAKRRKELWKTAVELQYGTLPPSPDFLEVEKLFVSPSHSTYRIITGKKDKPVSFIMRVVRPNDEKKFPVIVDGDMCFEYAFDKEFLAAATGQGIGWALFDRTELARDIGGEGRRKGQLYEAYPEYTFGAVGAWAWGYARCVDALLQLDIVESDKIIFSGHSRGGKTTLLAGVMDERASIVNPNETCAGAAGCYRVHMEAEPVFGGMHRSERLADLMRNYPFWMGEGMLDYAERENELPFDEHFLKALVAPRTLFVSEAAHDIWANPLGSYQTTMAAKEAYKLLGAEENLYWYFRDGMHCHTVQDVKMLVNLAKHKWEREPLDKDFERAPFEKPAPIFTKFEE